MECQIHVWLQVAFAFIPALPAVIDSRSASATDLSTEIRSVTTPVFHRIGIDKRDSVKRYWYNYAVAGHILTLPVHLQHLAGHILHHKELIALAAVAVRHLDDRRVIDRIARRILHVKTVSAQEIEAVHTIVKVRLGAIGHQRLTAGGGDHKRKAVVNHVGGRDTTLLIAHKANILVVVVVGRHQHINSHLKISCRRLPRQSIVLRALFLGRYPHGVNLLTFDIQLNVLIFVHTHIDIHLSLTHTRVAGDSVHHARRLAVAGSTGVGHILLVAKRQRRIHLRRERTETTCIEIIQSSRRRLHVIKGGLRQSAHWIDIFRRRPWMRSLGCRQCSFCGRVLIGSGIFGDVVSYSTLYRLLEIPPSLIGSQVHTRQQPIGVLHIPIYTGYKRRLTEVRSVGCGIDTVDERVVVAVHIAEQVGKILHNILVGIYLGVHVLTSRVCKGALLLAGEEESFFGRFHTRRSVALSVGAEIESLDRVTYSSELCQFVCNCNVEGIVLSCPLIIEVGVFRVEILIVSPL